MMASPGRRGSWSSDRRKSTVSFASFEMKSRCAGKIAEAPVVELMINALAPGPRASNDYFLEDRYRGSRQSGLRIMTRSIVGGRPPVSSTTSLSRSPPGAMNETAGVLSSDGVTPAVPPAWIGVLSWIVSEPLKIVSFEEVVVARMSRRIEQGYGVHSYCQPESGLNPSWFAVSAWLKTNCGI